MRMYRHDATAVGFRDVPSHAYDNLLPRVFRSNQQLKQHGSSVSNGREQAVVDVPLSCKLT